MKFSSIISVLLLLIGSACNTAPVESPEMKSAMMGVMPAMRLEGTTKERKTRRAAYYKHEDAWFKNLFGQRMPSSLTRGSLEPKHTVVASIGKFEITMESNAKISDEPFRMKVWSTCGNQTAKPKMEELIKDEAGNEGVTVCDFISHKFDEKSNKLTLSYMRSSDYGNSGKCNAEWSQTFDLNQICAPRTE